MFCLLREGIYAGGKLWHTGSELGLLAVRDGVTKVGLTKRATCHPFRHSVATRVLESGYDIRTIQELLGHKDVKSTMASAHVLNGGGKDVKSPVDDP